MRSPVVGAAWLVALFFAALWPARSVMAAPFTVDRTADSHDATPGDGTCADSSGRCTLRAAIEEANAAASADTITLPSNASH